MIDIEKIKQAALAATQGEWVASDYIYAADGKRVASYQTLARDDSENEANGAFIATANPSAILELINLQEAAESQLASQELVIQQLRDVLEKIACIGNGNTHGNSVGNCLAIEALTIPTSTKPLEAWYKEQVGEPVAWNYELTEEAFVRLSVAGINVDTPLHAIKPFKGE